MPHWLECTATQGKYYYNATTQMSTWRIPPHAIPTFREEEMDDRKALDDEDLRVTALDISG